MFDRFLALFGRPAALAGSVIIHATAVVAGGHALSRTSEGSSFSTESRQIEIEILSDKPSMVSACDGVTVSRSRAAATHTHPYPVAPDHDAHPHDPSVVHVPFALSAPDAIPAATHDSHLEPVVATEPVHFVLEASGTGRRAGPSAEVVGGSGSGGVPIEATYAEASVNVPARLLASTLAAYPEAARVSETEGDVPLEIVVNAEGHVVDARVLRADGYGFDHAAEHAIRSYRFSPALREGRPVRVRMHWTVSFRLR